MVWRARVFSGASIMVMGSGKVTTLHPQGLGDPELPPMLEAEPSLSEDYSSAVYRDGDPL
jgi:hypothetical protein